MAKTDLLKLKEVDVWSLLLFVLYKMTSIQEMSTLGEMAYILPKDSLLKLCEYYGGETIRVPTLSELENMLSAIMLYHNVDICGMTIPAAIKKMGIGKVEYKGLTETYNKVKEALSTYAFKPRT